MGGGKMQKLIFLVSIVSFFLVVTLGIPLQSTATAIAGCSEVGLTAVFLVSYIYPLDSPQLYLLDVAAVGPVTSPSEPEMVAAIQAVQPESYYEHLAQSGPFHLFISEPDDWGACAIVDGRDGRVVFAGTIAWLGFGSVTLPANSSHPWSFSPGDPAAEPGTVGYLPNDNWLNQYGTPEDITDAVVDYLRGSDILRSFGDCGAYDIVSYIYTPIDNPGVDPQSASMVVLVSGRCGLPWNDAITVVPSSPVATWLAAAAPNPFNPRTTVTFTLQATGHATLAIHNARGMEVARLVDETLASGIHSVEWTGIDAYGRSLPSGTYLCRLSTPWGVTTSKMELLR
jgi:hypothetical protein